MNTRYRCNCGWEGTENELHEVCTDHGDAYQPPEYQAYCPDCNANFDDMVEADVCISCESEFSLYALDLCAACTVDAAEYAIDNR